MKKPRLILALICYVLCLFSSSLTAQKIIKDFNEDKTKFIGFAGSGQFWGRFAQLNPGSTVNGEQKDALWDLSIRRYRFKLYGQLDDKTLFTFTFGNNNIGSSTKSNTSPKILDAYIQYQWTEYLGFGVGKSGWTGLSRYSAPATSSLLGLDIQFSPLPQLNRSDDLLRKLSVFAKGQYGILDYRIVLAKPYTSNNEVLDEGVTGFNPAASDYQASAYFKFELKDKEAQRSPFSPGTYHGKKNLFTIGVGALYQPQAMALALTDTLYYAAKSLGVDIFYENKLRDDLVLTLYGAYHDHDLGPDFIRQVGANNPADGKVSNDYINGKGVSRIVSGTGSVFHFEGGVLKLFAKNKGIQWYYSVEHAQFDAVDANLIHLESGFNYLLNNHRSKFTLGVKNWPVVITNGDSTEVDQRKSAVILQYQFKVG